MTDAPTAQPTLAEQIQTALQKIAPNARAIAVEVNDVVNRVGAVVTLANGVTHGFRFEGALGDAIADLETQLRKALGGKS